MRAPPVTPRRINDGGGCVGGGPRGRTGASPFSNVVLVGCRSTCLSWPRKVCCTSVPTQSGNETPRPERRRRRPLTHSEPRRWNRTRPQREKERLTPADAQHIQSELRKTIRFKGEASGETRVQNTSPQNPEKSDGMTPLRPSLNDGSTRLSRHRVRPENVTVHLHLLFYAAKILLFFFFFFFLF